MDARSEIKEFLTSRRARITPDQVGLATYGSRRVPGLRREEVAVLAGVSVPYYTRLERGDMNGASESVLEALARALQLDDAERAHLFDLARAAHPTPARPRRRQAKQLIRPEVQWTLDAITGAAAFVSNNRLDILAANQLGRALFSELYAAPAQNRPRPARRPGLAPLPLPRRARLPLRRDTQAPRQLGSHHRPRRSDARDRPKLRQSARCSSTASAHALVTSIRSDSHERTC